MGIFASIRVMRRSLLVVAAACAAAFAAQPPSAIRESAGPAPLPKPARTDAEWAKDLAPLGAAVQDEAPKKLAVGMTIDHTQFFTAVVSEPKLGVDVEVRRDGRDFSLSGYLKSHGWLLEPPRSLRGVALMGGGLNVDVRPFGDLAYLLSGPYKKEDGSDGSLRVRLDAQGLPARDFSIRAKGLTLDARWRARGYEVSGEADPAVYGKRELAVIGGALTALTDDLFR